MIELFCYHKFTRTQEDRTSRKFSKVREKEPTSQHSIRFEIQSSMFKVIQSSTPGTSQLPQVCWLSPPLLLLHNKFYNICCYHHKKILQTPVMYYVDTMAFWKFRAPGGSSIISGKDVSLGSQGSKCSFWTVIEGNELLCVEWLCWSQWQWSGVLFHHHPQQVPFGNSESHGS